MKNIVSEEISQLWKRNAELRALAHNPNTDPKVLDKLARNANSNIRSAVACNKNVSRETILMLANDEDRIVRYEANRNETHKEYLFRQRALFSPLSTL